MPLCTHYGIGNTLILTFGGYRQDMRAFEPIIRKTEHQVQWVLVHLPYINPESDTTTVYAPNELLEKILITLQAYTYQKIYLLGFSIGGRIAQQLFLQNPDMFDKLILMNADGLKKHILQWITEKKWITEKLLSQWIECKVWYLLIKFLQKIKLIPSKKAIFYLKHIQNSYRRKILIQIWKKYASYKTNLKQLAKHKDKVLLIWGSYDEVLSIKIAKKTAKKYKFKLEVIQASHSIIEQNYEELAEIIKCI